MKQLASFASLWGIAKWCSFWLSAFTTTNSLCGMYILRFFKFFCCLKCELSDLWMLPVHYSKHMIIFTLLYFYSDTRFLLLQPVHLEYHQQRSSRSFILKIHQNRHFWKSWFSWKSLKLLHQMSYFKTKMHQLRLGLRLRPYWGADSAPQTLAGFKGLRFWYEGRRREERDGRGRKAVGKFASSV